tara:strand:- start:5920 stop:6849 length:930 start_codon:yes stop_codon:yes gene_type:complete
MKKRSKGTKDGASSKKQGTSTVNPELPIPLVQNILSYTRAQPEFRNQMQFELRVNEEDQNNNNAESFQMDIMLRLMFNRRVEVDYVEHIRSRLAFFIRGVEPFDAVTEAEGFQSISFINAYVSPSVRGTNVDHEIGLFRLTPPVNLPFPVATEIVIILSYNVLKSKLQEDDEEYFFGAERMERVIDSIDSVATIFANAMTYAFMRRSGPTNYAKKKMWINDVGTPAYLMVWDEEYYNLGLINIEWWGTFNFIRVLTRVTRTRWDSWLELPTNEHWEEAKVFLPFMLLNIEQRLDIGQYDEGAILTRLKL